MSKQFSGITAPGLTHEPRLSEAKTPLRQTEYTVSETAYRLDFDAPTHMTRFVKAKTGQTPSGLRAEMLSGRFS